MDVFWDCCHEAHHLVVRARFYGGLMVVLTKYLYIYYNRPTTKNFGGYTMTGAKTGIPTIRLLGRALCRFISVWGPKIKTRYPERQDVHDMLDLADALCDVLEVVTADLVEYGD